ncbi:PE-PGRS family protein [Kitasatospora sp. NPDC058201]|uniref:PE-PGRS family protein n=1 Tax=unclassified Kitasatospora TaxID=2633591 RepID=UPI00365F608B
MTSANAELPELPDLPDLLKRAGLETVGDRSAPEALTPSAAWRPVLSGEVEPATTVRLDRPDAVVALNARWHRFAIEHGILGADGAFLIDVPGSSGSCGCRHWTRVRLTEDWDLAGVLGAPRGRPAFLTASPDGGTLLGVTSEDAIARLVAVERVRERQETSAAREVTETAEERAAAWTSLVDGPGPSEALGRAWTDGLGRNPALPEDLYEDLVDRTGWILYRRMPAKALAKALGHPDRAIRISTLEHQPGLGPEHWAQVLRDAGSTRTRWVVTMLAAEWGRELPPDTCRQLASDSQARVRAEAARLPGLPADLLADLAADPDPTVRAAACRRAWPHLDGPAREVLLTDPDGRVRTHARHRHHIDHPLTRAVFDAEDGLDTDALQTCRLDRDLAGHLARHGAANQRRALADNPRLDPDLVDLLGRDPDEAVRHRVALRHDLTEEQRAAVVVAFDPSAHSSALDWVVALHEDPDAMRRLAASGHPLIRRSVARARRLPSDVVDRLARDEDRVVRLFLAESCDDAPADMLMSVWQWWTGSLTRPDRPLGHPNFPRTDLLRHADDPNPRMRRLALEDPASTAGLVERFSRDADPEVRYRAATDPRLGAASAVRLLDDPNRHIRQAAAAHPGLPARVLVRLLLDSCTAAEAAAQPALPAEVMRRMAAGPTGGPLS